MHDAIDRFRPFELRQRRAGFYDAVGKGPDFRSILPVVAVAVGEKWPETEAARPGSR